MKRKSSNLPKKIIRVLQFLSSLNVKEAFQLLHAIVYLYREYYIITNINPVVKEYIVNFDYKDEKLISCKVKSIKEILDIVQDIKISRSSFLDG